MEGFRSPPGGDRKPYTLFPTQATRTAPTHQSKKVADGRWLRVRAALPLYSLSSTTTRSWIPGCPKPVGSCCVEAERTDLIHKAACKPPYRVLQLGSCWTALCKRPPVNADCGLLVGSYACIALTANTTKMVEPCARRFPRPRIGTRGWLIILPI